MPIHSLSKEQIVALARIVSDIVMADKVIDDNEITRFSNLFGSIGNRDLFYEAKQLTLAEAVIRLKGEEKSNKQNLENVISAIAHCDGICAPSEAKLLLALRYYLLQNNSIKQHNRFIPHYELYSFLLTDLFIGHRFIIYIESAHSHHNLDIEKNHTLISNLLAGIGFQFVYIPQIVSLYKEKGVDMFHTLANYLFPDIPEWRVDKAYDDITHMTTESFVKNHLANKMDFALHNTGPALLVMLGHDTVLSNKMSSKGLSYETYANMLKINIREDENILTTFADFVKDYNETVSFNHFADFNPSHNKLLYQGMYKVFFNLVVLAQENPEKPRIDINTQTHLIYLNRRKLSLSKGRLALYALMLHSSMFSCERGIPKTKNASEQALEELQNKYHKIYALMCGTTISQRASIYNTLGNRMSDIKRGIKQISSSERFFKSSNSLFYVDITPDNVFVDETPIEAHPEWVNL